MGPGDFSAENMGFNFLTIKRWLVDDCRDLLKYMCLRGPTRWGFSWIIKIHQLDIPQMMLDEHPNLLCSCALMYNMYIFIYIYYRRKFRSQTSDNMDRWKAEMGRVREEKRRRKRKSQKKEDPGARKGRKVAKHYVFPMICGSRRSKSRLAKAAGAEPAGQMRDEKLHAVVARSTFASEKAKSTWRSEHFSKLRCRKSARRCGAKHISKPKCIL